VVGVSPAETFPVLSSEASLESAVMIRVAIGASLGLLAACAPSGAPTATVASTTTSSPAAPDQPTFGPNKSRLLDKSLGAAAPIFGNYLNGMHNRIHPEYADKALKAFDALPADAPVNDEKLAVLLEIIVNGEDGRIAKLGVLKASGSSELDTAALESVRRAQPFAPAPHEIVSADGNVHIHWQFRRDEVFACSLLLSRPFLFRD
jgi:TonB family protein